MSDLAADGVKVNVTAMMTAEQVQMAADALHGGPPSFVSVFAGRIADTGRDPVPIMQAVCGGAAHLPERRAHLGEPP